jgi:hypothetical protein
MISAQNRAETLHWECNFVWMKLPELVKNSYTLISEESMGDNTN